MPIWSECVLVKPCALRYLITQMEHSLSPACSFTQPLLQWFYFFASSSFSICFMIVAVILFFYYYYYIFFSILSPLMDDSSKCDLKMRRNVFCDSIINLFKILDFKNHSMSSSLAAVLACHKREFIFEVAIFMGKWEFLNCMRNLIFIH